MITSFEIKLTAFYSTGDEQRFFQTLNKQPAIMEITGRLEFLLIKLDISKLDDELMQDFIALLHRYQITLHPLKSLSERFTWLQNANAFWYESMFQNEINF